MKLVTNVFLKERWWPSVSRGGVTNDSDKSDDLLTNNDLKWPPHDGDDDDDGNECVCDGSSSFVFKSDDDADGRGYWKKNDDVMMI